ncbi:MAG: DUF2834 domain-containing protein [Chloroflexi bacterium]|nr:DUF2834 domain-containing protein [Chloroflexota bacterium]
MKKTVYLLLAFIGFLLSYYFILRFQTALETTNYSALMDFVSNDLGALIAADLVISVLVSWIFIFRESRRLGIKYAWIYLVLTLGVGLCFSLPLFLYFREMKMEKSP